MILTELQHYLKAQGRVSLAQIAIHFGIEADALRGMLQQLVQKDRVRKLPILERCHGCDTCSPEALEFYEWVTQEKPVAAGEPWCCPNEQESGGELRQGEIQPSP